MAWVNTKSKRRWSAALAVGVIFAATCAVVAVPDSAVAADHRGGGGHRGGGDHRGGGGRRGGGRGGGYYAPPPVVYGTPYYAAPPVVYGLPFGLNINIR
ncbi:MAG: hypothetical protein ABSE20_01020 [Acetobacteraceae bacterium]